MSSHSGDRPIVRLQALFLGLVSVLAFWGLAHFFGWIFHLEKDTSEVNPAQRIGENRADRVEALISEQDGVLQRGGLDTTGGERTAIADAKASVLGALSSSKPTPTEVVVPVPVAPVEAEGEATPEDGVEAEEGESPATEEGNDSQPTAEAEAPEEPANNP